MADRNGTNETFLPEEHSVVTHFILACSPLVVFFNFLVLTVAYKYIKLQQRFEQYFVLNMTFADLIYGFAFMSTISVADHLPWYMYRLYFFVTRASGFGSVVFLLLLNLHKFVTLLSPLRSYICITKRHILTQIFAGWLLVVVTCAVFTFEPYLHMIYDDNYDYNEVVESEYYSVFLIVTLILPLSASLAISVLIFGLAQRNARQTKHWFRRIVFVFGSTVWTCATCLPYRTFYLIFQLCISKKKGDYSRGVVDQCRNVDLEGVLLALLNFGFVINPLITIMTQQKYRQGVRKLCRNIKPKKASQDSVRAFQTNPSRLALTTCSTKGGDYETAAMSDA